MVTVEAKSQSSPKTSSTKVTVLIKNTDGPPVFITKKADYKVTTPENVASGTALYVDGTSSGFRFSTDGKAISDFECTLDSITTVAILDHFRVDRVDSECQLKVIKNFVQISSREFKFQVRVTNIRQRNLFGTKGVTVQVTDTNDYPPEFTQSSYWVSVPSDTPSGTSLMQVTAIDRDAPGKTDFVLQLLSDGAPEDLSRFVPHRSISDFSLQNQYSFKQTGDENKENRQLQLEHYCQDVPLNSHNLH